MNKKSTKSLKEIYNKSLICEMPERMSNLYIQNLENNDINHKEAKEYIEGRKGKLVEKFESLLNIYYDTEITNDNKSILVYKLIDINKWEIDGFVKLFIINDNKNKYFSTHGLWKKKTFKDSLIFNFFTKWLLPKYKLIISDNSTSEFGEIFWWKIIDFALTNNKECGIYSSDIAMNIFKVEKFTQLLDRKDFLKAWKPLGSQKRVYVKE